MSSSAELAAVQVDLPIKLLNPAGKLPTQGSIYAAGLDLYSAEEKTVPARGKVLVDLGISIAVPLGHYGRIAPRSGLASKHGIQTGAGVIDSDYRGPVKVLLFNHSEEDFKVSPGDRIAQLILERISLPVLRQVNELDETVRGAGGFGSTGGFGQAAKKLKVENGDAVVTVEAKDGDVAVATNGTSA